MSIVNTSTVPQVAIVSDNQHWKYKRAAAICQLFRLHYNGELTSDAISVKIAADLKKQGITLAANSVKTLISEYRRGGVKLPKCARKPRETNGSTAEWTLPVAGLNEQFFNQTEEPNQAVNDAMSEAMAEVNEANGIEQYTINQPEVTKGQLLFTILVSSLENTMNSEAYWVLFDMYCNYTIKSICPRKRKLIRDYVMLLLYPTEQLYNNRIRQE